MEVGMIAERWILTVKELHLGHCKETFRAGAVIELDEDNGRLHIDGRKFDDTRDLDVLKRQARNNPDNPWVIPYSKEAREEILDLINPPRAAVPAKQPLKPGQQMQVIKSDEDLNEPIDIRDTQLSKVHAAEKQAVRDGVKANGMQIIRGDETVEERLASLKGKNDIGSIAERARIKASGSCKMAVVRDDSLGAGFTGKNAVSMNAGQHLPSREEAESRTQDAAAQALARKKAVEIKRRAAGIIDVEGSVEEQSSILTASPDEVVEVPVSHVAPAVSNREAALEAENSDLKARMDRLEQMMIAQAGTAPKRGRKPAAAAKE
jgi:hypothetical protein